MGIIGENPHRGMKYGKACSNVWSLILAVKVCEGRKGIASLRFSKTLKNILSEGKSRGKESLNYDKSNKNERNIHS